jgi:hypothetical protein
MGWSLGPSATAGASAMPWRSCWHPAWPSCVGTLDLQWTQVNFNGWLHVNRKKNGMESNHPLKGDELRVVRGLRRHHSHASHVFSNERSAPMSPDEFGKCWSVSAPSLRRRRTVSRDSLL